MYTYVGSEKIKKQSFRELSKDKMFLQNQEKLAWL